MAGGAAGGFITRAFESMLKECSGKKYGTLQTAINSYIDGTKEISQPSASSEANQAPSITEETSSSTDDGVAKDASESDQANVAPESDAKAEQANKPVLKGSITTALSNAGNTLDGAEAELVLNPLRLAFETKNVKVVELALDCLHKLIAYDHLEGDPGLEGGRNAQLFTDILNMVCKCVDNSSPDSTTLQVLKVLLTAVASNKFRVHGEPLLAVIRVCYNIALNSKSPINQATSKAMLTQMISTTFRRMETDQAIQAPSISGSATTKEAASENILNAEFQETVSDDQTDKGSTSGDAPSVKQIKEAPLASVEELQNLAGGADIKGLEAVLDKAVHLEDGQTRGIDLERLNIGQQDALLLFRTLCKMGMKEESDEVTTKTRILSLELLQGLLEGVSDSFTKNFHFIDSVKAYLSYALLRASVSQSSIIFQNATGIFSVLLLRFRESLKGEIGIFFPLIVLRPLDSSQLPPNLKLSVLRMLEKVSKDPQMLVDIYVNYDCDLEAHNLFERMVASLSKIAQGTQSADPDSATASQTGSVKSSSLQCLVNLIKSLIDWETARRESQKQSKSKLTVEESNEIKIREDSANDFEKVKAHKSTLEAAISEFNLKSVKGIEYLLANRLVENTPSAVAQFLRNTPSLDKAMIGDYLGQHEEFPLAVMHAYVDSMKLSGMKFDSAIREFLRGFRLPGEAQKIDRIMEKFAERYCADNPGLFKNADTAYVLAYAVIMLNTDAHNPMVWPKMSKEDFVHMNATNDAEECAPKELLEHIYDSIVKEEIKMKDDVTAKQKPGAEERGGLVNILNLALPKKKSSTDTQSESEAIVKQTKEIFRSGRVKRGVFYTSHKIELVRPMVEAVGWPLLAILSVTMGEGENKPRVGLCMEGFKSIIYITYVLGMDTMRYAFLTSLVRFNFLHAPKDMRSKNVEALKTLLELSDSETGALQDTWNAVLECISRLEYITSTPGMALTVMQGSNQISRDALLQSLRALSGKPAEQVFVNSVKLPSEAVVEFFTALCNVSAEELKQSPPRVFSLQKLVEISYYNMARIRLVWARIWSVLSNHFISAGSHRDEKIAMYAIDSLRQLGMKYLERAELANFTFQNDILKPFVILMRSSRSETVRRLIVDCIVQMIKSKVGSIKSGWRSVFMVFTAAADDDQESIVESAFDNIEQVILEHFDQVVGDCFMDCVNCLIGFANSKSSPRISLMAIALLRICEDRLAEGLIPGGEMKPIDANADAVYDVTEHYWFPMLAGLSDLTSDPRPEVRNCALEVLFDLLNVRGSKFSSAFWETIFQRVLFPIFDHVRHAGKEGFISFGDEWLRETSIHSLQLLCNLFNTFYKEVCFMLPPLLSLLLDCAKKPDQSVVSISMGALMHLIEVGGHQFSDGDWDTLLKGLRDVSYTTQPLELLNALGIENKNHNLLTRDLKVSTSGNYSPKTVDNKLEDPHQLNVGNKTMNDASPSPKFGTDGNIKNLNASMVQETDPEISGGEMSPSRRSQKVSEAEGLQRSQTFGQKIVGNMRDNIFTRSFTSKPKIQDQDVSTPTSPSKFVGAVESDANDEDESPLQATIRSKCITQLLLLNAIDSIQKKYWNKLKALQKITIMDILFSVLEFAASYNSFTNLKVRMHQGHGERPPLNLLRQELTGTCIYLDILQKTTSTADSNTESVSSPSEKIEVIAEEKLVSFCELVLRDASDFQSTMGETTTMEIHRILELRSPVIVKVLMGMSSMNNQIFRKHLRQFYPYVTKLVCCDQMDVRRALGDLFSMQLNPLVPKIC